MGQKTPPMEEVLKAFLKSRQGALEREELETLHNAGLLRAALHGSPQFFDCVFINFHPDYSASFLKTILSNEFLNEFLPEQASLRLVVERFGIDAIISGQLLPGWFEQRVIKGNLEYNKCIQDWCQLSFNDTGLYRWQMPGNQSLSMQPIINPSVDEVQRLVDEDGALTRFVYDPEKVPTLSYYALISSNLSPEDLWHVLGEYKAPIRDLYYNPTFTDKTKLRFISKTVLSGTSYLAVCEFDNFVSHNGRITTVCAMNRTYEWHSKVSSLKDKGILSVRLIPCVVVKDSYDILHEVAHLRDFEPKVYRPSARLA
jgi:hypothetical protein